MINLQHISKSYKGVKAVKDLTLQIQAHEYVALIGNNGCGKTTTIKILCNLLTPDEGEYLFENQKITPNYVSYRKHLGILLSEPYYIDDFTITAYWHFVAKFQGVAKAEATQRIENLLDLLDIRKDAQKSIANLSSGNKMKVSIGACLIHNPRFLILDEPFVNLDIETTEKVIHILKSFKGKKTIFITSHQLELVLDLCDKFVIMDAGELQMTLNKSDFESVEALKEEVKKLTTKKEQNIDISWLK